MKDKVMTPMMRQYHEIKEKHQNSLLFYRMGDFYELFHDDAIIAAKTLDIALTKRGKEKDQDIPMCGVPFHAYESYLAKLVKSGFNVAICEQMESPEEAKKRGYKAVVKRDVVRVVTPGTITEDNLLEKNDANYLLTIAKNKSQYALAWSDISTGDLFFQELSKAEVLDQIVKLNPKEILTSDNIINDGEFSYLRREYRDILVNQSDSFFSYKRTKRNLESFYEIKFLDALGNYSEVVISALGALIEYIKLTQIDQTPLLKKPSYVGKNNGMQLDASTITNLEIFSSTSGDKKHSLVATIDNTKTAMGARLIRRFLYSPLTDLKKIKARQDSVDYFYQQKELAIKINEFLKNIGDFERAIGRLSVNRGGPRDIVLIRESLRNIRSLESVLNSELKKKESLSLSKLILSFYDFSELLERLEIIIDSPPMLARDGGFVKLDQYPEIKELIDLKFTANDKILELQEKYRVQTGVNNLRIKATNILGYYIEVGSQHADKIDKTQFIHRQTLANATRFVTEELIKTQEKLNNAESLILAKELQIYEELCQEIINLYEPLSKAAKAVSYLDIFVNNALLALQKSYTKPELVDDSNIYISSGYHPVVKENLPEDVPEFINNDCVFKEGQILHLLTGPNMAGKSTYLRQNALIILLAQTGLFIPAKSAKIGIVDRIFSRIGASDDLSKGRSTFMMEMLETAAILNQATDKSFVILDEIGRGTATFDGMALASAIVEYLSKRNKSRALFATHYHELIELESKIKDVKSFQVEVSNVSGKIIFKHKISEGHATKSYGIAVAKLAGLPHEVIKEAEKLLKTFEKTESKFTSLPLFEANDNIDSVDSSENLQELTNLKAQIIELDINNMTPVQALNCLSQLKKEVQHGS